MSNEKKHRIMEQSRELFERFGYGKTKLADIAKSVGYVKSAIYYYFSGKEEIFEELVRMESESFLKQLIKAVEIEEDAMAQLQKYVDERINIMQRLSKRYHFLKEEFFELMPMVEEQRKPFDVQEVVFLTEILNRLNDSGQANIGDTTFSATLLMQNLKGLEVQMFVTDAMKAHEINRKAFIDFLLFGVLNNQ